MVGYLLLHLVNLLLRRLPPLVPVLQKHLTSITHDLELDAQDGLSRLDEAIASPRLAVLVVPGALEVGVRLESVLFEGVCVLLYNGELCLEGAEARVETRVGGGEVGRQVGEGRAEVGGQRGLGEGVVGLVEEGEGFGAQGV